MAQISSSSGRTERFSFAISDGLVVHPSTRPMATPSRNSVTLAVSRKIFMAHLLPGSVESAAGSHPPRPPGIS
jgi:hypothetical protein